MESPTDIPGVIKAAEAIGMPQLAGKIRIAHKKRRHTDNAIKQNPPKKKQADLSSTSSKLTTRDVLQKYKGHGGNFPDKFVQDYMNRELKKNPKFAVRPQTFTLQENLPNNDFRRTTYTAKQILKDGKISFELLKHNAEIRYTEISKTGPWTCKSCKSKKFNSYFDCRYHHATQHNLQFDPKSCDECGKRSEKKRNLFHHRLVKHGKIAPGEYEFPKCTQCPHISLDQDAFQRHVKSRHGKDKKPFKKVDEPTESMEDESIVDTNDDESTVDTNEESNEESSNEEESTNIPPFETFVNTNNTVLNNDDFQVCNFVVPVQDNDQNLLSHQHQFSQIPSQGFLLHQSHQPHLSHQHAQMDHHQNQFLAPVPYSNPCNTDFNNPVFNQMDPTTSSCHYYQNHQQQQIVTPQNFHYYHHQQQQLQQQQNGYCESYSSHQQSNPFMYQLSTSTFSRSSSVTSDNANTSSSSQTQSSASNNSAQNTTMFNNSNEQLNNSEM